MHIRMQICGLPNIIKKVKLLVISSIVSKVKYLLISSQALAIDKYVSFLIIDTNAYVTY